MHKYIFAALLVVSPVAKAGGGRPDPLNIFMGLIAVGGGLVGAGVIGLPFAARYFLGGEHLHNFLSNDQAFRVLIQDWHNLPPDTQKAMQRFANKAAEHGNEEYRRQLSKHD